MSVTSATGLGPNRFEDYDNWDESYLSHGPIDDQECTHQSAESAPPLSAAELELHRWSTTELFDTEWRNGSDSSVDVSDAAKSAAKAPVSGSMTMNDLSYCLEQPAPFFLPALNHLLAEYAVYQPWSDMAAPVAAVYYIPL
jgi:hypothetical protein